MNPAHSSNVEIKIDGSVVIFTLSNDGLKAMYTLNTPVVGWEVTLTFKPTDSTGAIYPSMLWAGFNEPTFEVGQKNSTYIESNN